MDFKQKYLRIGRMEKRKRELRGNKYLILKGKMKLKKYRQNKINEGEDERRSIKNVNNPKKLCATELKDHEDVQSNDKLGKHGMKREELGYSQSDQGKMMISKPIPSPNPASIMVDKKESHTLITRSLSFQDGMTAKDYLPSLDDYLNSSLQIQHKLMRSNTLLTKLTSLVNDLGSKVRRVEEDYFHLELKYRNALDKLASVEAELCSCQVQFYDMEYNLALKEEEISSLQLQVNGYKLNLAAKDRQIYKLQEYNKSMNLTKNQSLEQSELSGVQSIHCQTMLKTEELTVMEKQADDLAHYKKEKNKMLEKVKSLEESQSLRKQYVTKLQAKLNELSLENQNITSTMENIVEELSKIDIDVAGFINKNKCNALHIGNLFAKKNTKSLKILLARERQAYLKKVDQVNTLERDICHSQTKLQYQQFKNKDLEKLLLDKKLFHQSS